jgi:hypothetical protein
LQDTSDASEDNLRREARIYFMNKEREYLKNRINELKSNSKNKNIREFYGTINECKECCHHRTNLIKDEMGDLLADPHKMLNRWKNYFCQLLNVHGAGVVRQTEMHTAEPFVPRPSASEAEFAIGKLRSYKSPGVDENPTELIQAEGEILGLEIHKLTKLIWKKELLHQWKVSIVIPIHKKGDKT